MFRTRFGLPQKLPEPGRGDGRGRPLSLDGYVRVSRVGRRVEPRFISPQLQQAQIRAYAAAHGCTLGEIFFDVDRSGTLRCRPGLEAALARIHSGESDGIIVARLDRLARTVSGGLRTLAAVEAAGATVISVEDGLNPRTPFGRALSTILLALAELEVGRIGEGSRISRSRMVLRGIHQGGARLPGYRRGPDGRLQPHPVEAPVLVEAFERRAAGATYKEIAGFLCEAKVGDRHGERDWSSKRVYRLLQNPAYVGEAYAGSTRNLDAHPPLVRRALWLAALAASTSARANAHGTTLLAGLLRCGGCCHVVGKTHAFSHQGEKPGRLFYRCRCQHRAGYCQQPASGRADAVEGAVVDSFLRNLEAQRPRVDVEPALVAAEEELCSAEACAASHPGWRSAYTDTEAGDVAAARAKVLALWRRQQLAALPPAEELRQRWRQLPPVEQRRMLTTGLESVILFRGTAAPAARIQLLFAGSRRDFYPKPGLRRALQPFEPAFALGAPSLAQRARRRPLASAP
jgi:DNA invertase Pin-like site-specific DNA recombinase